MAGVKISALPSIVAPALTDVFPVVQSGVTYKETITQLGTLVLLLGGGTMTGNLILNADPSSALQAATKQYVDAVATGLNIQPSCRVGTVSALTVTYSNGTAGVGATLTNAGAMAALSIDGVSLSVNDRVLVKDQASTFQNGIYTVTTVGSGAVNWVMTRATDFDTPAEIQPGDFVLVVSGTVNAQSQWVQTATVATIGTDPIVWNQFGADINSIITAIQNNTYVYCEDTGAADAYVATPSQPVTAYVEGLLIILDPDNANATATPTLNVSGLGVKTITNNLGGALVAGDIVASQRLYLLYDGTNFRLLNRNYEKRIQNDSFNYILDTGAADAYVATLVPAVTAYVAGQRISLKIANTNLTSTPTVNVNALGAKTIVKRNGGAVAIGSLIAGMIADLRYDGTNYMLENPAYVAPTQQRFTSGSGTYTTPAGVLALRVRMVGGGGGGGAGSSNNDGGTGGTGGTTTFGSSLLTCTGGAGGTGTTAGVGGAGGAATLNSPAYGSSWAGGRGSPAWEAQAILTTMLIIGGDGAGSVLFNGGGAGATLNVAGYDAVANSGGGGGGGANTAGAASQGGRGGGSGASIDAIIASPSATYAYAIGAAGTAGATGTGGFAGGAGSAGYIEVTEYYQ